MIKPDEISSIIKNRIENYELQTEISNTGSVLEVGDGIARGVYAADDTADVSVSGYRCDSVAVSECASRGKSYNSACCGRIGGSLGEYGSVNHAALGYGGI